MTAPALTSRCTNRCCESYVDSVEIGGLGHCGGTGNAGMTQLEISVVYRYVVLRETNSSSVVAPL